MATAKKLKIVIADSSGLVALVKIDDSTHATAIEQGKTTLQEATLIIPTEVFSETLNTLWKKTTKQIALEMAKNLLGSSTIIIAETNRELRELALDKFENRASNKASFTDCLVMATADSYKTPFIFGFDETFKKNGYQRLGIDT